MSRELKFRIYVPQDKGFIYFGLQDYPQGIYGAVSDPMQFTGLKDKDGREIYEGDIIKCIGIGDKFEEELTGMVFFQDAEYCIDTNHCKWPVASFHVLKNKEIIGNIHENSNLLN